jgi:hypothetical protein
MMEAALNDENIASLFCTICYHDLNHHAYKICAHPLLDVPLCLICHDELESFSETENFESDQCDWCQASDYDVFICEDASCCKHQFCSGCLENNLGSNFVKNVNSQDLWKCLVCNPRPLAELRVALKAGMLQSHFHKLSATSTSFTTDSQERDEDQIAVYIGLIEMMAEEANEASQQLEMDSLVDKEALFRKEISSHTPSSYRYSCRIKPLISMIELN